MPPNGNTSPHDGHAATKLSTLIDAGGIRVEHAGQTSRIAAKVLQDLRNREAAGARATPPTPIRTRAHLVSHQYTEQRAQRGWPSALNDARNAVVRVAALSRICDVESTIHPQLFSLLLGAIYESLGPLPSSLASRRRVPCLGSRSRNRRMQRLDDRTAVGVSRDHGERHESERPQRAGRCPS